MAELPLEPYLDAIEADLRQAALSFTPPLQADLAAMITYHLGWADESVTRGKRLRPLLTVLACQACGGDWRSSLPAASAVELIHNFSLVHDDIEDNSQTRRGRLTLWARWGIPQALNAGDAMFALAHLSLDRLREAGVPAETAVAVQHELSRACLDLTLGQHLDMAFETRPDVSTEAYAAMISGKTAALLAAGVSMGARIAAADARRLGLMAEFGRQLGLAFQMQDDILGIWGDPAVTGKPAGDDLTAHKKSLPTLLGLERSPRFRELWGAEQPGPDGLESMRAALAACGAQAATHDAADQATQKALAALDLAGAAEPAAGHLAGLARQLLARQR